MRKELIIFLLVVCSAALVSCDGYWIQWSTNRQGVPANAVVGGQERNGQPLYVIRGYLNGVGSVVGKYSLGGKAYFSYGGDEYSTTNFEILAHTSSYWANSPGGYLVSGGNGQFICRVHIDGNWVNGKLHKGACFIPYGGREIQNNDWETLKE